MAVDLIGVAGTVGAMIGSAIAAFLAGRAKKASEEAKTQSAAAKTQSADIAAEMMGPADEPTVRQLLMDSVSSLKKLRTSVDHLESGQSNFSDRLAGLENTVNRDIEQRLGSLETARRDTATITSAIESGTELLTNLSRRMRRAEFNLHRLANSAKITLATQEEVEQEDERRGPTLKPS